MGEDEYHSIDALSASGMKHLRASPMDYWARSPMNQHRVEIMDSEDSFAKLLGSAYHKRIVEGPSAFAQSYAPSFTEEDCPPGTLKTNDQLKARLAELGKPQSGNKQDLIARLLLADPEANIYELHAKAYAQEHLGKIFLPRNLIDRIEIAAAMIEKHPQLSKAFSGGAAEVTIMWEAPTTLEDGTVSVVPMKARLDYLKPKAIVDLKSFGNPHGKPIQRAVNTAFANYRYHIPAAVYTEAAAHVSAFIKEGRMSGNPHPYLIDGLLEGHDKTFLFVFQCSGVAPVAVGKTLPVHSGIYQIGKIEVEHMRALFARCVKTFGTDPWIETSDITAFDDSEIPSYASE